MKKIDIKIYKSPKQRKDNSLSLTFELTNSGSEVIYVLKRDTPLEGLRTDCIIVKVGSGIIPYDSIFINRDEPAKSEFVLMKPGKSVKKKFIINEAYNIDKGGVISVRFRFENLKLYYSIPELKSSEIFKKNAARDFKINGRQAVKFTVRKDSKIKKTKGERFRSKGLKRNLRMTAAMAAPPAPGVVMPPIFTGGNEDQQSLIRDIHNEAYEKLNRIVNNITNDINYENWFGEFDIDRFNFVKNNFIKIRDRMESIEFDYDTTRKKDCAIDPMMSAYTYPGKSFIIICDRFFDKNESEQVSTIIHEHSHATAETKDVLGITNYEASKNLAAESPDKAIICAGNYEFYAREV